MIPKNLIETTENLYLISVQLSNLKLEKPCLHACQFELDGTTVLLDWRK
jgi:hypothetical protein